MLLALLACSASAPPTPEAEAPSGAELAARFQCARCHAGPELSTLPVEQDCVGCHAAIFTDRFESTYTAEGIAGWRSRVHSLRVAPSLVGTQRLRAAWLDDFLARPHDLRPGLPATMPRLPLTDEERDTLVTWLGADTAPAADPGGDVDRGLDLLVSEGCGSCHRYTGAGVLDGSLPEAFSTPVALAPDLAHARERMSPAWLAAWLEDPRAVKPDTTMPSPTLSEAERTDVVAALTRSPLQPAVASVPEPLPLLERPVTFEEVEREVLAKVCRHCHSAPSEANDGDGGPGNTGGFGYAGGGLDLSSYEGVVAGRLGDDGRRVSVLEGSPPPLVAAMWRRHEEGAGTFTAAPGMPLGFPPMSPEQIRLVSSWIDQGAPPPHSSASSPSSTPTTSP